MSETTHIHHLPHELVSRNNCNYPTETNLQRLQQRLNGSCETCREEVTLCQPSAGGAVLSLDNRILDLIRQHPMWHYNCPSKTDRLRGRDDALRV
ncbi:hypothetical protein J6590_010669 [Homalodisca vitripennis]|nr:hypothetical protein J6590_010669 [Homalodisca vitripennis]